MQAAHVPVPAGGTPGSAPSGAGVVLEVIVPAYNEAARLPGSLWLLSAKLRQLPFPAAIVVVDNGSTDETAAIVRGWPKGLLPVRLLECAERGKGAAIRAGLLHSSAPVVGFCDADMATDLGGLEDIVTMVRSGCTSVIGSRSHRGSVVEARHTAARRLGARAFRLAARQVVAGVGDTQCGFKFFDGPAARTVATQMCSPGFAFDVELLARVQRGGGAVVEVPVRWRDAPGSTFSPIRDGWRSFREVYRIWNLLRAEQAARRDAVTPVTVRVAAPGATRHAGTGAAAAKVPPVTPHLPLPPALPPTGLAESAAGG
jgi:dolichyl-phosphate beta-glucosyltransferase